MKVDELREALKELHDAVESKADLGNRRSLTVSPRMEDALAKAKELLERAG